MRVEQNINIGDLVRVLPHVPEESAPLTWPEYLPYVGGIYKVLDIPRRSSGNYYHLENVKGICFIRDELELVYTT